MDRIVFKARFATFRDYGHCLYSMISFHRSQKKQLFKVSFKFSANRDKAV